MTALPLTDHPVVIAAAAEMAREHVERMRRHGLGSVASADALTGWAAEMLCDLSRPASRSFWREWLAARHGLACIGGLVFTRVAAMKNGHPSKVGDWIVEDYNGSTAVVLRASKVTSIDDALAAAVLAAIRSPE